MSKNTNHKTELEIVQLCVLCGYHNKQPSLLYTALIEWFYNRDEVFTERYELKL